MEISVPMQTRVNDVTRLKKAAIVYLFIVILYMQKHHMHANNIP